MRPARISCFAVLSLAMFLRAGPALRAADWPAFRHDAARSGVTKEQLPLPLHVQWTHAAAPAPRPAWPEPGRELNRMEFDYAYQVAACGDLVYFGSSANHKVAAIEMETGRERWSFFTGGPVRFAPAVDDGRVFVASDDGTLYCLSAAEGKLLWRVRGGPRREKILGNEQMISRWPLRTGVAIQDGAVIVTAGMWPSDGIQVLALRPRDGTVVWKNDTSGLSYRKQPHPGSFSMSGVAPQGYLLADAERIFVPTGRNVPAAYDRASGKLLYYRSAPSTWNNRWGGTWNLLAGKRLFGWTSHVAPDTDVRLGECPPDPRDGIIAFDAPTGRELRELQGRVRAVVRGKVIYAAGADTAGAYDLEAWLQGKPRGACALWETRHPLAYSVILAGETLFLGSDGGVTALGAGDGRTLWKGNVDGKARGLAVAGGRLLVSTTRGHVAAFGPKEQPHPQTITRPDAPPGPAGSDAAKRARNALDASGKKAGYCLVVGSGDGTFLRELAEQSKLTIICVEPDAANVLAARKLLDAAGLYGTRVTVHCGSVDTIDYPDYFADLILADKASTDPATGSASRLVRLLHPSGGVALFDAAQPLAKRLRQAGVPAEEIAVAGGAVRVTRGKLPGAGTWTHQYATAGRSGCGDDRRVRLPLELLWFGKPGPSRLIARHWAGPAPLSVGGRMFIEGQHSLTAVDAYNGRHLWRRELPGVGRWPVGVKGSNMAADADSLYVAKGRECLRIDAATGTTRQKYPLPEPPSDVPADAAAAAVWGYLAVTDEGILGSLGSDREGRCVFLLAKDDGSLRWIHAAQGTIGSNAIAADERRVYLLDRTADGVIAWARRRGKPVKATFTLAAIDARTGSALWRTHEGVSRRKELWTSGGVVLATGGGLSGYAAGTGKLLYDRNVYVQRFPVIVGDTIYAQPAAYDLHTGEPVRRASPFGEETVPWTMNRGYGCGFVSAGQNLLMFRSSTLGIYDLVDDSGIHNFGGLRAGCAVNAVVAGGLLLMPPGDASCTCSYSFRTTIVLKPVKAPAGWSIFYDRLPSTTVQKAALNLGAPGDRRDSRGVLWLAAPRPGTKLQLPAFSEPLRFSYLDGFGPYRRPLEAPPVSGTKEPWIYSSGMKGLRKAELDLEIFDRGYIAWPAGTPPAVDGNLSEPCWDGYHAIHAAGGVTVTLRHDQKNIYAACEIPPGGNAPAQGEPEFELAFSSVPENRYLLATRCVRLGVSASGARRDASWSYVSPLGTRDVPPLEVTIDGQAGDWGDGGLRVLSLPDARGRLLPPEDFDPSFRLAWSQEGLILLAYVRDDRVVESQDAAHLERGDSIDIFLTPALGSAEGYRVTLAPGVTPGHPEPRCWFNDKRTKSAGEPLKIHAASKKTGDGYVLEALLPFKLLKISPARGRRLGIQLFASDHDGPAAGRRTFRVMWHPRGNPLTNKDPVAFQELRLAARPGDPVEFRRGKSPGPGGLFAAEKPYPFPLQISPMGARPENDAYAGDWSGAARRDTTGKITMELAIPRKTLAAAGLDTSRLMVRLGRHGPLLEPPLLGRGFEKLILVSAERARPRRFSLRLHFAETEAVRAGQRIFDVKVDGRTVLKSFDILEAAGGPGRAVVKRIDDLGPARAVTLELVPKARHVTPSTAPLLSGIEIRPSTR